MLHIILDILFSICMIFLCVKFFQNKIDQMNDNQKESIHSTILTVIGIWLYRIEDTGNQFLYDKKIAEKHIEIMSKEVDGILQNYFFSDNKNNTLKISIENAKLCLDTVLNNALIVSDDYDKLDKWYKYGGHNKIMSRVEYRKEKKIIFDRFCIEKDKIVNYLK